MQYYAEFYKQEKFSDCDVNISVPVEEPSGEERPGKRARIIANDQPQRFQFSTVFPGHQIVLCKSEYFKAQVGDASQREGVLHSVLVSSCQLPVALDATPCK